VLRLWWVAAGLGLFEALPKAAPQIATPEPAGQSGQTIILRLIDSETGYAVRSDQASALTREDGWSFEDLALGPTGQAAFHLPASTFHLTLSSGGYRPFVGEVRGRGAESLRVDVRLDPLVPPPELQPSRIVALHRNDATVLLGFVVDDDTGEPLTGVSVSSAPSGARTRTDPRGFFEFPVPVQTEAEAQAQPASLSFEQSDYQTEVRLHLELWPNGDWTYRIRMKRGSGTQVTDESLFRRRPPPGNPTAPTGPTWPAEGSDPDAETEAETTAFAPPTNLDSRSGSADVTTLRVPRNIRVQNSSGIVEYVSLEYYCRHVLPAEWIASWASYTGGSNSLNAGAVAIRTYAVGAINNPRTTTYDICGTTSCQVYGATTTTAADAAVSATADWVLIDSNSAITSGLAEYSAENNQLGATCGDGFSAPASGCRYDPVCAGESTSGHGRGLCQWGSARWATARRMAGRRSGDATPTGYPRRDWIWILRHYYPALTLIRAAPLTAGDPVRALRNVNVRGCAGGTISEGVHCPALATKPAGATGTLLDGPLRVLADGGGWTWYKVRWGDVTGWSVENYLERVVLPPPPPLGLAATATTTNTILLTWSTPVEVPAGWKLDRAPSPTGPWLGLAIVDAKSNAYSDTGSPAGSTWFYRLRAYNSAGESTDSPAVSATTFGWPPSLAPIPDLSVTEATTLRFVAQGNAPELVHLLADFEPIMSETANGVVLFRDPHYASASSGFLEAAPNLATVTDTFPTSGHGPGRVLRIGCRFSAAAARPWLRLTTAGTARLANPVIDLRQGLTVDLYADRPVAIALGCRETTTPAGTTLGADGGTSGPIEWVGVTGVGDGAPLPSRILPGRQWTHLTFDLPQEAVRSFAGGNDVLSTGSGLGVLEHLAIVPQDGPGEYNLYLDNLAMRTPKGLAFKLEAGAPAGATIDLMTGAFSWTPNESQSPGRYPLTVRVTDNQIPPLGDTRSFTITVYRRPTLAVAFTANDLVTITWGAVPGAVYRMQYKDDLSAPAWNDVAAGIIVTGSTASITDVAARQRFYRVLVAE
jgi:hypothetical protein